MLLVVLIGFSSSSRFKRPTNIKKIKSKRKSKKAVKVVVQKEKISPPLELRSHASSSQTSTDTALVVTYLGIGKNGEPIEVNLGAEDSEDEKNFGLMRRSLERFECLASEDEQAQVGLAITTSSCEENLEFPSRASTSSAIDINGKRRRMRMRARSGSLTGMMHRVRDSISEGSREARFGFDFGAEAAALGILDDEGRKTVRFLEQERAAKGAKRGWFRRTFDRLFKSASEGPLEDMDSLTALPKRIPRSALAPSRQHILLPFPRESPPPASPAHQRSPAPSNTFTTQRADSFSTFLPLHIEPFRVSYDSPLNDVDYRQRRPSQRHSLPGHVFPSPASGSSPTRPRSLANSTYGPRRKSKDIGTQYSYHDFAHPPDVIGKFSSRPHSNSFASHSSSNYPPTPPTRVRQDSTSTFHISFSHHPNYIPPPLPHTPPHVLRVSCRISGPSTPSSAASFPLQFPSPSALQLPSPLGPLRSPKPSMDSVTAALGRNRSDAIVLAFVEKVPKERGSAAFVGASSESETDDGCSEINFGGFAGSSRDGGSEMSSSSASLPLTNNSSSEGAASSLRRVMDARAQKILQRASNSSLSDVSVIAVENEPPSLPITPPQTPHQTPSSSLPPSPTTSIVASARAKSSIYRSLNYGAGSETFNVLPPTPTSPHHLLVTSSATSRTTSIHEPLSKRMSLRYELALAANADIFGRRGSGDTMVSFGSESMSVNGELNETKARTLRMGLLRKVVGSEGES
ncbi:hypothetical protein P7C70_g6976, partial [Phenoliferia sp. Uapishka_3]